MPYVGKKLKLNFLPHYDSRVKKWVIPFLGADSDIVKLTHRLAYAGQTSEARPYPPTQFTAYIALSSFIGMVLLLLGMTFVGIVAQFRDGKKLLLKVYLMFSITLINELKSIPSLLRLVSSVVKDPPLNKSNILAL